MSIVIMTTVQGLGGGKIISGARRVNSRFDIGYFGITKSQFAVGEQFP